MKKRLALALVAISAFSSFASAGNIVSLVSKEMDCTVNFKGTDYKMDHAWIGIHGRYSTLTATGFSAGFSTEMHNPLNAALVETAPKEIDGFKNSTVFIDFATQFQYDHIKKSERDVLSIGEYGVLSTASKWKEDTEIGQLVQDEENLNKFHFTQKNVSVLYISGSPGPQSGNLKSKYVSVEVNLTGTCIVK